MFTLTLDAPAVGTARLRLAGHLDDAAARDVLHAAADVAHCGCSALVLDLDGLTSWDADAAFAVVGCVRLARWLSDGVDVVATSAAARGLAAHAGIGLAAGLPGQLVPTPLAGAAPDTMAACHAS